MFKSRVALAALAAALLSIFAAPAANAAAYAPPVLSADAPTGLQTGDEFTVVFHSTVSCQQWSFQTFQGQSAPAGSGTDYPVTLTAPDDGTYTLTAFCTWDPAQVNPVSAPISSPSAVTPAVFTSASSSDTLLAAPQTDPVSVQIVVGDANAADDNAGDDEADENGALPNTGGSNLTLLAVGAGLVVVGAGVTVAARRRKTA